MSTRPNVVVIVSDTFRRDHLGAFGNTYIHTPHIDEFARLLGRLRPARDLIFPHHACKGGHPDRHLLLHLYGLGAFAPSRAHAAGASLRSRLFDHGRRGHTLLRQGRIRLRPGLRRLHLGQGPGRRHEAAGALRLPADVEVRSRTGWWRAPSQRPRSGWRDTTRNSSSYTSTPGTRTNRGTRPSTTPRCTARVTRDARSTPATASGRKPDSPEMTWTSRTPPTAARSPWSTSGSGGSWRSWRCWGSGRTRSIFFTSDHGFYFGEHGYFGKAEWINDQERSRHEDSVVPDWLPESWLLTVGWSPLYKELTRVPLWSVLPAWNPVVARR